MGDLFGIIFGFIYLLIWITVVARIVSAVKKTRSAGSPFSMHSHRAQADYTPESSEGLTEGSGHMHIQIDEPKGFFMSPDSRVSAMEDRQHDWLARQIAEEKKFNKLDLGAVHERECAAEDVANISRSIGSAADGLARLRGRKR